MLKLLKYKTAKILVILFLGILSNETIVAQKIFQPKQIGNNWKGIIYKKEYAFDVKLHTNGFSLAYNSGTIKSYFRTKFYHLELGYLKDPREKRQNRNYAQTGLGSSSDFVFGKQNSLWVFRAGMGYKKYLSEKAARKGVAVGYSWQLGPSIALLRPYYLTLIYSSNGIPTLVDEKYTEENADVFLDRNRIYGGTSFFDNINEITFKPGVQANLALHFAVGAFDKYVRALEVGVMGDLYAGKVPILVETEAVSNKPYFINFYLNLQLGLRTN